MCFVRPLIADPLQGLKQWVEKEAPPQFRPQLRIIVQQAARFAYSGPLPAASEIAAYENAVPDAGNRILKMAERAQELDATKIGMVRRRINAATIISLAMIGLSAFGITQGLV